MKLTQKTSELGWFGLAATPEDYDGHPGLPVVWFQQAPRTVSPDRLTLAGYLLFKPWISGRFETPVKHSPALSQAILEDARPTWVQTSPLELYAKHLPVGARSMSVALGHDVRPTCSDAQLVLERSDVAAGASLVGNRLSTSSNAWLLANASTEAALRVATACGVLFAEDMAADVLVIPVDPQDRHRAQGLQLLLSAVRLGLETT